MPRATFNSLEVTQLKDLFKVGDVVWVTHYSGARKAVVVRALSDECYMVLIDGRKAKALRLINSIHEGYRRAGVR